MRHRRRPSLAAPLLALAILTAPAAARCEPPGPALVLESCDFWSDPVPWDAVRRNRPDWKPSLGFYNSGDDAVADQHLAWAHTHGIAAIQSCWYRAAGSDEGAADGFIRSVVRRPPGTADVSWDLFWDNTNPAGRPVSGAADFLAGIAAPWIAHDLTRPDYFRLDGKPVVAISSAAAFARDLGGAGPAAAALATFRGMARRAGLPGLVLLTANNANQTRDNALARAVGFDAVMAYATPPFTGLLSSEAPDDAAVIAAEEHSWSLAASHSVLPTVVTASVGFDARLWSKSGLHYLLSPGDWGRLVEAAIATARQRPATDPGHRIVILDALNEFGEGHFIEPTKAFGDAYLRALDHPVRP